MRKIPSTVLDTDRMRPRERFALWREAIAPTHEAALPGGSDPLQFGAYARGFNLGPCLAIETRVSAQVLTRTSRAIRADQLDSYVIRLQRRGRWRGDADDRAVAADARDVMVLDMARPSAALGTGIDNINVIMPRDVLDALLPPFDMHGLVLQGAPAALLRSYVGALADNLPHLPAEHAPEMARATCNVIAACLAPSRETAARARTPLALTRFTEIRRYVDRHLSSPALTPDAICKALGLSRSTLYAACEPFGGVAALIQRRRLDRIRAILADPRDGRRISEIAYQHGFVSNAHFSRAFRSAFGVSPSEARETAVRLVEPDDSQQNGSTYEIWIRQLTGSP
jgi:AraC-like DNA-binding protein